ALALSQRVCTVLEQLLRPGPCRHDAQTGIGADGGPPLAPVFVEIPEDERSGACRGDPDAEAPHTVLSVVIEDLVALFRGLQVPIGLVCQTSHVCTRVRSMSDRVRRINSL